MNKIATLATIIIASAGLVATQPAQAEGLEGGARFQFTPNIWGSSKAPKVILRAVTPIHTVRSGMVPAGGAGFLGVDPSMLSKPVAPPSMQVAATPNFGTASPKLNAPAKFDSSFGKPAAPPVVAKATAPVALVAKAAPPLQVKPDRHSNLDVHAVLAHRPHKAKPDDTGMLAHADNGVASYGQGVGYKPGGFNPAAIGGGWKTTATVSATLIKHH